jgi:response regulator NasT
MTHNTALTTTTPRWRVAVLDDDDRSRAALDTAIRVAGGQTAAESSRCAGALELLHGARADVAIVAAHLPDGDAVAVAAEATASVGCPVVLVGRHTTAALVARALEAGVMAFLLKPLRRGQLALTLDVAVARFRETQRLRRALEDRKVIERAKGRLMERERLTEGEAFRRLRTTAMNTRRPMVEIAHEVLAGGGTIPACAPATAAAARPRPVHALTASRPYGWTTSRVAVAKASRDCSPDAIGSR